MRLREPMSQLRPVTAATFDVLITLSEEPRKDGFKKDHIDVSNATAGDPTLFRKDNDDTRPMRLLTLATIPMRSSGRDEYALPLYRDAHAEV